MDAISIGSELWVKTFQNESRAIYLFPRSNNYVKYGYFRQ